MTKQHRLIVPDGMPEALGKYYANHDYEELVELMKAEGFDLTKPLMWKIRKEYKMRKSPEMRSRQSEKANVALQKKISNATIDRYNCDTLLPNTLIGTYVERVGNKTIHRML